MTKLVQDAIAVFMRETNAFVKYTDHLLDNYQGMKDIMYAAPNALADFLNRDKDQCLMAAGFLTAMIVGLVVSVIKDVALRKTITFSMAIFIGCQVLGIRFLAASTYQLVGYLSMLIFPRNV